MTVTSMRTGARAAGAATRVTTGAPKAVLAKNGAAARVEVHRARGRDTAGAAAAKGVTKAFIATEVGSFVDSGESEVVGSRGREA